MIKLIHICKFKHVTKKKAEICGMTFAVARVAKTLNHANHLGNGGNVQFLGAGWRKGHN